MLKSSTAQYILYAFIAGIAFAAYQTVWPSLQKWAIEGDAAPVELAGSLVMAQEDSLGYRTFEGTYKLGSTMLAIRTPERTDQLVLTDHSDLSALPCQAGSARRVETKDRTFCWNELARYRVVGKALSYVPFVLAGKTREGGKVVDAFKEDTRSGKSYRRIEVASISPSE